MQKLRPDLRGGVGAPELPQIVAAVKQDPAIAHRIENVNWTVRVAKSMNHRSFGGSVVPDAGIESSNATTKGQVALGHPRPYRMIRDANHREILEVAVLDSMEADHAGQKWIRKMTVRDHRAAIPHKRRDPIGLRRKKLLIAMHADQERGKSIQLQFRERIKIA
ncbi:hypothetical protein [Bradyrhizobium sp. dw_78]|uniref:hypothetical protein n=1 Tax=Bradyrhizobium sp. dw_78 TaxID=2719793 RepID=UPI001BD3ABC3|nr:hypothetical protein [Bradyrhizobium sp. dw_78]